MNGIRRWLVLAAMDEERNAISDVLGALPSHDWVASERARVRGRRFTLPGGRQVTLLRCGVGTLNATLATSVVCENERPDAILLLGVGGALRPELEVGDLVVARSVLQHDSFSSLDSGDYRKRSGEIILCEGDARRAQPQCPTHHGLSDWIRRGVPGSRSGTLVSGNEFVARVKRKRELSELASDALLVDMEGSAVAWTSERYGVPFAVAKTVADRLAPDGTISSDFSRTLKAAAGHAAQVTQLILEDTRE
jgi:adenosylhomocysteine nucleosidase